jgi:hypothetical protein
MNDTSSGGMQNMATAVQIGPSGQVLPADDESPFSGPITTGPLHPALVLTSPFDSEHFSGAVHAMAPAPAAADRVSADLDIDGRRSADLHSGDSGPSDSGPAWSIEPNLRARGPAYAVMEECLSRQEGAAPRGRLARALGNSPLHPDARSWYSGALGEIVVANALTQLGDEWTVLHAVRVGHSDIDHVILGPGGVYTINTKNHSGEKIWIGGSTFLVNGYKQEYVRNSAHEAERASRLLSVVTGRPVTVTPVIVVVNPASITSGRKRPRVTVLSSSTLKRWLVRRPRVLSDRAVAHFSMFAEEHSTWNAEPVAVADTTDRQSRFEQLRMEVDAARQRARLWLLALGVCAMLITPVAIAQIVRLLITFLVVPGS